MGNGVSTDQGNLPPHGSRDVRNSEDEEQHDWSQLARAPNTNTALLVDRDSYSGTRNVGPRSSSFVDDGERMGTTYSGARTCGSKSSTEDDTRQEDDQPRGRQLLNAADDDTQHSRQDRR